MLEPFSTFSAILQQRIRITQGSSTSLRHRTAFLFRNNRSIHTDVSKHLRLENCFLVARPCPRLRPMSSDPAVAAPAAQVPLRHAREGHRCTLFGTSQAWDIPDVLRGLHRESRAFKAWRMAQLRLSTTTTRVPRTQKHSLFREGSCRLSKIIPPCAKDERQT